MDFLGDSALFLWVKNNLQSNKKEIIIDLKKKKIKKEKRDRIGLKRDR